MKRSQTIALIAVFAALNAVCDSLVGLPQDIVWYGWIFLIEPLNGVVLGPLAGALSTLIGVIVGHTIYFRGETEYLFTIGAPLGAMISGLVYRKRWRLVLVYYTMLFVAYFLTPVAWNLPLWGMWDTILAFAVLCAIYTLIVRFNSRIVEEEKYILPISAFIGLEADILFRIFLLIPCQTYRLFFGFSVEALQAIWGVAAFVTPIQVAISMIVTTLVGLQALRLFGNERDST